MNSKKIAVSLSVAVVLGAIIWKVLSSNHNEKRSDESELLSND